MKRDMVSFGNSQVKASSVVLKILRTARQERLMHRGKGAFFFHVHRSHTRHIGEGGGGGGGGDRVPMKSSSLRSDP